MNATNGNGYRQQPLIKEKRKTEKRNQANNKVSFAFDKKGEKIVEFRERAKALSITAWRYLKGHKIQHTQTTQYTTTNIFYTSPDSWQMVSSWLSLLVLVPYFDGANAGSGYNKRSKGQEASSSHFGVNNLNASHHLLLTPSPTENDEKLFF